MQCNLFYLCQKKAKEFTISDEQKTTYFNRHYEQLQKQWKEHSDRFLGANLNKLNENEISHQLKESLENLVNVSKVIFFP